MTEPFSVQLGRVNGIGAQPVAQQSNAAATEQNTTSFLETLESVQRVKFSNHAQSRMQSREISMNDENVNRLSDAIDNAKPYAKP